MKLIARTLATTVAATALMGAGTAWADPVVLASGGGYTATEIAYNFRNIASTGAAVFAGSVDDVLSGGINLGFDFTFFGHSYNQAYVSSNGFLTFSPNQGSGCCNGGPMPAADGIRNVVAGWWTDLVAGSAYGSGTILTQTIGAPGSRSFVLAYLSTNYFYQGSPNTFEIILHEGSNNIELQYAATGADGHTRSVGIENDDQTLGVQLLQDNSTTWQQRGFQFSTAPVLTNSALAVPEPGALALAGLALAGLLATRRRA